MCYWLRREGLVPRRVTVYAAEYSYRREGNDGMMTKFLDRSL
jgi:hypothetical protein